MVAADGLVPVWRQGICNHRVNEAGRYISGIPQLNVEVL